MTTKNKKRIILIAATACVLAIAAFGTLAYFTSVKEIKNTFTVGNIEITLDESKVIYNEDTGKYEKDVDTRVTSNTYKYVVPGVDLPKDPKVSNTGTKGAYVGIIVKVPQAVVNSMLDVTESTPNNWKDFDEKCLNQANTNKGVDKTLWAYDAIGSTEVDGVKYYVYRFVMVNQLEAKKAIELFSTFTVKSGSTPTTSTEAKDFDMLITAYAVQASGYDDRNAALTAAFTKELYIEEKALPALPTA